MIQGMSLLFSVEQNSEQFAREVVAQLNNAGLQVIRSFDFQAARTAHTGYSCPYHGADTCTCQLIMLLVYSQDRLPVTLVIHGNDQQTWVSIVNRPEQRADVLKEKAVLRILLPEKFPTIRQPETNIRT